VLWYCEALREEDSLYKFAQNVGRRDMGFLDTGSGLRIHNQGEVGTISQFAATASGQSYRVKAHITCRFHGDNNIPGAAACTDPHGNVVFSPQGLDLLGKDFIKRVVIGDTGQDGGAAVTRTSAFSLANCSFTRVLSSKACRTISFIKVCSVVCEC